LEASAPQLHARLAEKKSMTGRTNFDRYLEEQLRDPDFAERFKRAGEAWDVSLQIARLRERAGLSQKDLADRLKTTQQQISRLESPDYEGHSLSMLRRVARELNAHVRVIFEAGRNPSTNRIAEPSGQYRVKRRRKNG
jgi:ribosome-binding protein aMBF1 (putative translation factor)